jgi:hypothetical protein
MRAVHAGRSLLNEDKFVNDTISVYKNPGDSFLDSFYVPYVTVRVQQLAYIELHGGVGGGESCSGEVSKLAHFLAILDF